MNYKKDKKKKIIVFSSNRSEFGILSELIKKFSKTQIFDFHLILSGTHQSNEFGKSINESKKINCKKKTIYLNEKNYKNYNYNKIFSELMMKLSKYLIKENPDFLIILGDRYETLAAALSARFCNLNIAHIHGGELSEGSIDDQFRHCISKLSNLHFVTCKEYKNRLIQLGENPKHIIEVGSLSLENIGKLKLLSKSILSKKFNLAFRKNNIILSLHSETSGDVKKFFSSIIEIKKFLLSLKNTSIFMSMPAPEKNYKKILKLIFDLKKKENFYFRKNFGYLNYVSLLKNVDCIIGNSSSGLIEAPFLKTFTINLGNRQNGRIKPPSVFDLSLNTSKISKQFNFIKKNISNNKFFKKKYFYKRNAALKIIESIKYYLKNNDYSNSKKFFDLV